jgi:hypothetical protein
MSLMGVMRLLGHNDFRMTLRYTAITQETIRKEYYEALAQIEKRYSTKLKNTASAEPDPVKMLSDITRWLHKNNADDNSKHLTQSLIKRIKRIQSQIKGMASMIKTK